MQLKYLALVAVAAVVAHATPVEKGSPKQEYQRYVDIVGDDNQVHKVDLEEARDVELLAEVARNPARNRYFLFTRYRPDTPVELVHNEDSTIWNSGFEGWKRTVVIVHGWRGNGDYESGMNQVLKDRFLAQGDYNVIVMDWSRLANSGYATAATGVPAVGRGLGQFIQWLYWRTGTNIADFHLVGFSLGAHLVGNAGRYLRSQVSRITGLDPSGPLWQLNSDRLSASDAVYVEVIHTDGGLTGLGIGSDLGNVDFYVNGGNSQPGCLTSICDHNRAWEVFAASIIHQHLIGRECSSNLQLSLNRCSGKELPLGNADINKKGSGRFRVNTGRRYPF